MSNKMFQYSDEFIRQVSYIKRFLELLTMDEDFPVSEYKKYAEYIGVTVDELRFLYDTEYIQEKTSAGIAFPQPIQNHHKFVKDKLEHRSHLQKEGCVPSDVLFRKWRRRQVNRCWCQMGIRNVAMIHTPIVFELSKGCSVGCDFCGLDAKRLSKVFTYNDENARLWKEVLEKSQEIIGEAASTGICYCATEPFDNPHYELFNDIFNEVFGVVPQVTTAVAMRKPERTKAFLASNSATIHRFSVLSKEILRQIYEYFTPEELFLVELLPQFESAPSNSFTKVGKNYSSVEDGQTGTICCLSGFIVNMPEKSMKIVTPCMADDEHPTGELIFGTEYFDDADDFGKKMKFMIQQYMKSDMYDKMFSFYPQFIYKRMEKGFQLSIEGCFAVKFNNFQGTNQDIFGIMGDLLKETPYSAYELADSLLEQYGIAPELSFYAFSNLYDYGVLCSTKNS